MPTTNPAEYYADEDLQGNYQFVGIEDLVNNFTQNFTGDDTLLGYIPRSKVIYQVKQAIREFTYGMLSQVHAVEYELNDANNIILPPDFVSYVRVSWVNQQTGQIQPMSESRHHPLATAYLQDNAGDVLFDNNGEILEGTTALEAINDALPAIPNLDNFPFNGFGCWNGYTRYGVGQIWNLDASRNFNGTFDINDKRIHFGADSVSRIILLEYVSDGLEVLETEMKVPKFAEQAVYDFVNYNLGRNSIRLPDYEKRNLEKASNTSVRNAKVRLLKIKPQEFIAMWRANKNWIR